VEGGKLKFVNFLPQIATHNSVSSTISNLDLDLEQALQPVMPVQQISMGVKKPCFQHNNPIFTEEYNKRMRRSLSCNIIV
jgi:hypothetical protein